MIIKRREEIVELYNVKVDSENTSLTLSMVIPKDSGEERLLSNQK